MKEIGIITYHSADNYGAVLQAYALSKYLASAGADCKIINYRCPAVDLQYQFRSRKKCFSWKNFFAHNLTCIFRLKKRNEFKKFRKILPLTDECTRESIAEITSGYDAFISGSDQVFNPVCNKSDPTYFLDFVRSGKKYAFSGSMGSMNQFESSKIDTIKLLSSFDGISMRESAAAKYLSEKLGKKCISTMDPVWLLNKEEWENVTVTSKKKPYILVYNLLDLKHMRDFAIKLSKKTGFPIVAISRTIMGDAAYMFSSKIASACSPNEFLGYIHDAQYVITDSFHGTSFSILFEKKVFVALDKKTNNTNGRLETILEKAGLLDRVINERTINDCEYKIDYEKVKSKLEPEIEFSKEYLNTLL